MVFSPAEFQLVVVERSPLRVIALNSSCHQPRSSRSRRRYRLSGASPALDHALSHHEAPAFEAHAPVNSASPDRPPSPSHRSPLHRTILPQNQSLLAHMPRPNRPDRPIERPWPLPNRPIDVEILCHGAPTCCAFHESHAIQPACAMETHHENRSSSHLCRLTPAGADRSL